MNINLHNVTHIAIDEISDSLTFHRTIRIFTGDGERVDVDLFGPEKTGLEPVKVEACITVTEKDIDEAR